MPPTIPGTDAAPRRTPLPVRVLLAPLHALERSRGRFRLLLVWLYTLALIVLAGLVWRASSLNGLPDVGDPFDPAEFDALAVPEEENAFTLYHQASARFRGGPGVDWDEGEWSKANPETRRCVEDNAEALALWMRGSERERGLSLDPRAVSSLTVLSDHDGLRTFARMGVLAASRRRDEGDLAGAWAIYRAILRASRHAGTGGGSVARTIAAGMVGRAAPAIAAWADDPRVSEAMLREALGDLRAARTRTPPPSQCLKAEYLILCKELASPEIRSMSLNNFRGSNYVAYAHLPYVLEFLWWAKREPERSLRLARLFYVGALAHADEPASRRPPATTSPKGGVELYPLPADAPAAARALSAADLEAWLDSTFAARSFYFSNGYDQSMMDRDLRLLSSLEVLVAAKLYEREHGAPATTIQALVGPYLDRVPEGYEALDDPTLLGGSGPKPGP